MTSLPGLGSGPFQPQAVSFPFKLAAPTSLDPRLGRRLRTWELPPHFHCSIVGTCLTTSDLRQILTKAGDADARAATEHVLHSRGVRLAGQRDGAAKLLNKALDRRHDTTIRRFSAASDAGELRRLWRESYDRGDISSAYWAVLSHPETDEDLVRDVFGEVHMLSHLVGRASRLDIARLSSLEKGLEEKDDKLRRQELRLSVAAAEQAHLRRRVEELELSLANLHAAAPVVPPVHGKDEANYVARLEKEQKRAHALAERLRTAQNVAQQAEARARVAEERSATLEREHAVLEEMLLGQTAAAPEARQKWQGGKSLYVGGRRSLYDRLLALALERGVELLLHDGGLEDSTTLLAPLVAQAETVLLPVDHVSHTAAEVVKRACKDSGKSFMALRSSGLTSFAATLEQLIRHRPSV